MRIRTKIVAVPLALVWFGAACSESPDPVGPEEVPVLASVLSNSDEAPITGPTLTYSYEGNPFGTDISGPTFQEGDFVTGGATLEFLGAGTYGLPGDGDFDTISDWAFGVVTFNFSAPMGGWVIHDDTPGLADYSQVRITLDAAANVVGWEVTVRAPVPAGGPDLFISTKDFADIAIANIGTSAVTTATSFQNPGSFGVFVPDPTDPELPDGIVDCGATCFDFRGRFSGNWYDPTPATQYTYEAGPGTLFTGVELPPNFGDNFVLSALGCSFAPSYSSLTFIDLVTLCGEGIPSFTVSGISPPADADDPLGFPTRLTFNHLLGSFRMFGLPVTENHAPGLSATSSLVIVAEGQLAENTGIVSDADGDDVSLTASVGAITNNGDGTWSWSFGTIDGPAESQTVTLYADDGNGGAAQTSFAMTVNNVAPMVTSVTLPGEPVAIGDQPVSAVGTFTDPGTADTHTCTVDYGDGAGPQSGTVGGATCTGPNQTYSEAGIYTVTVSVTDKDGGRGSLTAETFIVIYDPTGGFVTGGGWISSPAGAYIDDPSLTGKANFGFVSKYKKGASVPTGNTEFQFKAADLNFHSSSYEWLVVTGSNYAKFKGVGTINGMGEYKFMIWAGDDEIDTFRIKIWLEDEGGVEEVLYDNGFDQAIGGGSIVIHTK